MKSRQRAKRAWVFGTGISLAFGILAFSEFKIPKFQMPTKSQGEKSPKGKACLGIWNWDFVGVWNFGIFRRTQNVSDFGLAADDKTNGLAGCLLFYGSRRR